jgi:hypothetical protein
VLKSIKFGGCWAEIENPTSSLHQVELPTGITIVEIVDSFLTIELKYSDLIITILNKLGLSSINIESFDRCKKSRMINLGLSIRPADP